MIETKKEVNSNIDWEAGTSEYLNPDLTYCLPMHNEKETLLEARKHYFGLMRRFLNEVHSQSEQSGFVQITSIFDKYNVHFVDVDDFPRINIDEPKAVN